MVHPAYRLAVEVNELIRTHTSKRGIWRAFQIDGRPLARPNDHRHADGDQGLGFRTIVPRLGFNHIGARRERHLDGFQITHLTEESAIREVCPDPDRVWAPEAGEPVVGSLR